ncbi:precorrin-6y C5,15-methyltransferase (decarboxylating) subunit CbiE [Geoalkalibacter halelectricus]|uniref:Precorrin-6y C5,15-methyltransferase (Decarboxylating) subunit CbiE n=1 Tax=Geoalkalibacter halelectricus TaxID=2847045 RepID=A0ABY5ZQE3_9BACT|nr:precorrin-6y C5,15-methyltransferase (decarboxylating) subunit CbiE [Geoalkalibacter halelectricus]MDO3377527.1 precorrin-6y C5,15-methyltransferase (decarboxylating) subunit CbiE [Geoalkalibacter halelectricus]UWZ80714.1 precorrin-6y C5,15-methyltransferase (decarboxylating) subunit CbiE [Geoalkalibacter halelectricus]
MNKKIYVIGAGVEGHEGFGRRSLDLIAQAGLLIGGERQLELFPEHPGRKVSIGNNLAEVVELLTNTQELTVVLTSGDPLFFSIGRYLLRNLPAGDLEFIPNVSSVQYAFAKIKVPWDDAVFISAHGRGLKKAVDRIVANDKAAILTDEINTPKAIATELTARGREGYAAYLCEELGTPRERILATDVKGLLEIEAAPLNVLILIKEYDADGDAYIPTLGIPDEEFAAVKKLITKEEVRVIALAKLQLRHDMCLWDIGAGSGSVSIEADHLLPNGRIFAVERNPQCLQFIRDNLRKFNARNISLVEGEAPACLENLPDPDRVFIGGSGGNLWDILKAVDERLPAEGRIVLNAITLDTLTSSTEFFDNAGYDVEVTAVNISRTRPLTDYKMFEANNPVFVITATKK